MILYLKLSFIFHIFYLLPLIDVMDIFDMELVTIPLQSVNGGGEWEGVNIIGVLRSDERLDPMQKDINRYVIIVRKK